MIANSARGQKNEPHLIILKRIAKTPFTDWQDVQDILKLQQRGRPFSEQSRR